MRRCPSSAPFRALASWLTGLLLAGLLVIGLLLAGLLVIGLLLAGL